MSDCFKKYLILGVMAFAVTPSTFGRQSPVQDPPQNLNTDATIRAFVRTLPALDKGAELENPVPDHLTAYVRANPELANLIPDRLAQGHMVDAQLVFEALDRDRDRLLTPADLHHTWLKLARLEVLKRVGRLESEYRLGIAFDETSLNDLWLALAKHFGQAKNPATRETARLALDAIEEYIALQSFTPIWKDAADLAGSVRARLVQSFGFIPNYSHFETRLSHSDNASPSSLRSERTQASLASFTGGIINRSRWWLETAASRSISPYGPVLRDRLGADLSRALDLRAKLSDFRKHSRRPAFPALPNSASLLAGPVAAVLSAPLLTSSELKGFLSRPEEVVRRENVIARKLIGVLKVGTCLALPSTIPTVGTLKAAASLSALFANEKNFIPSFPFGANQAYFQTWVESVSSWNAGTIQNLMHLRGTSGPGYLQPPMTAMNLDHLVTDVIALVDLGPAERQAVLIYKRAELAKHDPEYGRAYQNLMSARDRYRNVHRETIGENLSDPNFWPSANRKAYEDLHGAKAFRMLASDYLRWVADPVREFNLAESKTDLDAFRQEMFKPTGSGADRALRRTQITKIIAMERPEVVSRDIWAIISTDTLAGYDFDGDGLPSEKDVAILTTLLE